MIDIASFEKHLEAYIANSGAPEGLQKAMAYSVLGGGKRLRPMMCLNAAALFCGSAEVAIPCAAAIELIQAYSLIHDDLPAMDNDDFRRGKPSNHKVFGEWGAILAGDGLLSLAVEIMINGAEAHIHTAPNYLKAVSAVLHGVGVSGMVGGQWEDVQAENTQTFSEDGLLYIHKNKTAAPFVGAIECGAIIGGANEHETAVMRRYGEAYGILFQITDDILDVAGNKDVLGKTTGKDEQNNKLTYVSLYGVERAKQLANEAANCALSEIKSLGRQVDWFVELVEKTMHRSF